MSEADDYFTTDSGPNEELLRKEAQTRFREVFVYGGDNGRYVLTYLLNMLCFWQRCESDEHVYLRNAATELLSIMGIGRPEDREGLIGTLIDYPIDTMREIENG